MGEYTVKIIVAAHKPYTMPADPMYLPIHVGAVGKESIGYQRDDEGENISILNPYFCELTGLYWAWKNLPPEDYIGLVHYRRHFGKKTRNPFDGVLTYSELQPLLSEYKIFVPQKRKYYIETLYSHYQHTHYASQLDITREIIAEKYPDYLESYYEVINHTYGYMFNMMIMQRQFLDDYCKWLFDILFELKKRTNLQDLSAFQSRFYGRVSEIIFNVWMNEQIKSGRIRKSEIKELPYQNMEKINWWKKGTAFLKAKFFGKRYEESF